MISLEMLSICVGVQMSQGQALKSHRNAYLASVWKYRISLETSKYTGREKSLKWRYSGKSPGFNFLRSHDLRRAGDFGSDLLSAWPGGVAKKSRYVLRASARDSRLTWRLAGTFMLDLTSNSYKA